MISGAYFKFKNACKFGGFHFLAAILCDKIFHTKTKRKVINKIIAECVEEDEEFLKKKAAAYFSLKTGQKIDYLEPKKFSEKIQWIMLHDSTQIKAELTDKYLVRTYITKKIGDEHLIPLLGVWDRFEEIDFEKLPEQFVLKCNHGSGMNVVVKNKEAINQDLMRTQFDIWLNSNFSYNNFELQYNGINPKILAEKYIEQMDGNLYDYKVHCFNGEPRFIQVIGNRDFEAHTAKQLFYDFNWKSQSWTTGSYPKYVKELPRPNKLEVLYDLSKKLCYQFDYVRVDFYIIEDKILFGEMTFTPNAGLYQYNDDFTEAIDCMLGEMIKISKN